MRINEGSELQRLRGILLNAFSPDGFEDMLRYQLNQRVYDLAARNANQTVVIRDVINWYNGRYHLEDLIGAARKSNPDDPYLADFARTHGLAPNWIRPQRERDVDLERNIRALNRFIKGKPFREAWAAVENRVCYIELPNGDTGTGFLVASNLIMTNHHVIKRVKNGDDPVEEVKIIFDYTLLKEAGKQYQLAEDWLVDDSPCSEHDAQIDPDSDPSPDQLDYALLRVKGTPGLDPVGAQNEDAQAHKRGWLTPYAGNYEFQENGPLLIVQHPKGQALQTVIDPTSIINVNGKGTRVRYRTNTEKGSSGSPCFDLDWRLIALHHAGDPIYSAFHHSEYNQGIPFTPIIALMKCRNVYDLISTKYVDANQ